MKLSLKLALVAMLLYSSFFYCQDYNFNSSAIPESLKKDAHSVMRFDHINVEINSQRSMNYTFDMAVTVLNNLADDEGNVLVYYDKRRKIKNVLAIYYDALGNQIKKVKQKDFKDYSASGGSLFDDSRVIYYDYTPISYPYTVHYTYEIETSNTAFIPNWIYTSAYNRSTEKSSYKITHPSELHENYKDKVEIKQLSNGLEIIANNITAIKHETLSPSIIDIVPSINFALNKFNLEGVDGEANNWNEYGKWFYNSLIKETLELPEATQQKMLRLTENAKNNLEKAKIIYQYVQDKVRYISVQIGVGGFKPMLASDVDRLGYGDCKALTNYTAALLDVVGIPSHHVLVYAQRRRDFDSKIASQEGNHMILYLPINNEDVWLECTSQDLAFGELGDFTDNRDVLVITPEGGIIKHTKKYKPAESVQTTKGKYTVNTKGTVEASLKISSTGIQYDNHLSSILGKNPKDLEVQLKNYFSYINNITFSKTKMLNNKEEAVFEEELEFVASDYATFSGDQMFITVNAFNKNSYSPKRIRNRKLPFEILRGYTDVDEVEIELPKNWKPEYIPESKEITSKLK